MGDTTLDRYRTGDRDLEVKNSESGEKQVDVYHLKGSVPENLVYFFETFIVKFFCLFLSLGHSRDKLKTKMYHTYPRSIGH